MRRPTRPLARRAAIAAALVLVAGCRADDGAGPAPAAVSPPVTAGADSTVPAAVVEPSRPAVSTAAVTTVPPVTTAPAAGTAPVTSGVPASTAPAFTAPASTLAPRAAVWVSAVDPARVNIVANHPIGEADGVTSSIDMFAVTPADPGTPIGRACIDTARDLEVDAWECLVVQFRFRVAADFRTDGEHPHAELTRIRAVLPDGGEVAARYGKWARPGAAETTFTILLPGAAEHAVVHWSTGSALVGYTEFSGTVPGMILPVEWLGRPPASTPSTVPVSTSPSVP